MGETMGPSTRRPIGALIALAAAALAPAVLAAASALAQRTAPDQETRRHNDDSAPPSTSGSAPGALSPGLPGSTVLAGLAGTWRGAYFYANSRQRPVEFVLTLEVEGGVCRGRTEEPNTFGHRSAPKLFASVQCSLTTGTGFPRLVMRKVYDGTGGQSHAVDYVGELSADGRSLTGTWSLAGGSGSFRLSRQ
jgi:hypothetical protein